MMVLLIAQRWRETLKHGVAGRSTLEGDLCCRKARLEAGEQCAIGCWHRVGMM